MVLLQAGEDDDVTSMAGSSYGSLLGALDGGGDSVVLLLLINLHLGGVGGLGGKLCLGDGQKLLGKTLETLVFDGLVDRVTADDGVTLGDG